MSASALVFPGQGAQAVGMARDAAEASRRARDVFDHANTILGVDLAGVCFRGPAERLEQTDIQQPAIFVASVALWESFLEVGGAQSDFRAAGGLSLGEYTALYAARAVEFEDALRLVRRRGELMQAAAEAAPSGMVSLIGADERSAEELCRRARGDDVLVPANFNCPGQVVISGGTSACKRAVEIAADMSLRAVPLAVAGAFHSPLMEPAADGLATELERTPFTAPQIPVIANVDAEYYNGPDEIRDRLRRQLTHPVLWQRCIERLLADGAERVLEVGPGRVLTGLMRKINRTVRADNLGTWDAIRSSVAQARER